MSTDLNKHYFDLMDVDTILTEDQKAVAKLVAKFVDEKVLPTIATYQRDAVFPLDFVTGLRGLGILESIQAGMLDATAYGVVLRELERGGSTLRSFLSVQGSLVMSAIRFFGSEPQRSEWLGPLSRLELIGCFGLTEPDFGSNPNGMRTRADRTKDGFILNGSKCWITNGTLADVAIIWAKLDGEIKGFIVETDREGFESRSMEGKWSFRTSDTAQLFLENVEIPETNQLPGAKSLGSALKCLNEARYGIAWGVVGAARGCFEETLRYLKERIQFGNKPLASHQIIQERLSWMASKITTMELMAHRLGQLKQSEQLQPHQISLAKMHNCRMALEVARSCRELLGAAGIDDHHHIGRHMADLETVVTYEGTEQIHSLVLGKFLTGIDAFGG